MPELVKVHLRGADCLVLESNHDLDMLKVGLPWLVKQRVLSRTGHLSNHAVSEYLCDPDGFDAIARYLVLGNDQEFAVKALRRAALQRFLGGEAATVGLLFSCRRAQGPGTRDRVEAIRVAKIFAYGMIRKMPGATQDALLPSHGTGQPSAYPDRDWIQAPGNPLRADELSLAPACSRGR